MILILGGTTEGKLVASLLDDIECNYLYSTRNKVRQKVRGPMIRGTLDAPRMKQLCLDNKVELLIDAAHPFAVGLHQTVHQVSVEIGIKAIRFERNFPRLEEDEMVRAFDTFEAMTEAIGKLHDKSPLLSLTGVQTISHYRDIHSKRPCFYRILDSPLSWDKGIATGMDRQYLLPGPAHLDVAGIKAMVAQTGAKLLTTKESGESGYYQQKVKVARELGIPLWVVRRPVTPELSFTVASQKELLQAIYEWQKETHKSSKSLRSGFTTGSCVTAATKASFCALMEKKWASTTEIQLPDGQKARFPLFPLSLTEKEASCIVIKNSGDDPDVTHAAEIGCHIKLVKQWGISLQRGEGIGLVTLPGLQVKVGEPAINPVPRQMLIGILKQLQQEYDYEGGLEVTPFIPEGKKLAKRTFNPRIGVVDGLSVLGTSGRVMPYSLDGFIDAIREQVHVAYETGSPEIVATSGKRSERLLKPAFQHLNDYAYIHFGNFIGETLAVCAQLPFERITLGIMLGKAIKLAEGNLNTHSKHTRFNASFAAQMAQQCGHDDDVVLAISKLKLANAVTDYIPIHADEPFYQLVVEKCQSVCCKILPQKIRFQLILIVGDTKICTN